MGRRSVDGIFLLRVSCSSNDGLKLWYGEGIIHIVLYLYQFIDNFMKCYKFHVTYLFFAIKVGGLTCLTFQSHLLERSSCL